MGSLLCSPGGGFVQRSRAETLPHRVLPGKLFEPHAGGGVTSQVVQVVAVSGERVAQRGDAPVLYGGARGYQHAQLAVCTAGAARSLHNAAVHAQLAVAVFLVLWTVRPGSNSELLEQARARQAQGLVAADNTVDSGEIAQSLAADQDFVSAVADAVAADDAFVSEVASGIEPAVQSAVEDYVSAYVQDNLDQINSIVVSCIDDYVSSNMSLLTQTVNDAITAYVDANYSLLEETINNEINAYVDANYDALLEIIRTELAGAAVDTEALTQTVSDAIYQDVMDYVGTIDTQAILDSVSASVQKEIDAVIASSNAYTDSQISALESQILTQDEVDSLIEKAKASALDEISAQLDRQAAVISAPDFTSSPVVRSEDSYQAVREAERQGAIQSLLNSLAQ